MLKRTMTYETFDGDQVTEDFYFNLTKAELMEMSLGTYGGLDKFIEKIVNTQDTPKIIELFKEIVLKSYGQKSDDGKRFIKSPEIREAFAQTNAYSDLFMTLSTDADEAAAFINGLVPKDIAEEMEKKEKESETQEA